MLKWKKGVLFEASLYESHVLHSGGQKSTAVPRCEAKLDHSFASVIGLPTTLATRGGKIAAWAFSRNSAILV